MNRRASIFAALCTFVVAVPALAHAEEPAAPIGPAPAAAAGPVAPVAPAAPAAPPAAPAPAATTSTAPPSSPAPVVELSADDGRATLERRVGTSSPGGLPIVETGIFSVGHWEHACIAPCAVPLDPKYAYRVAGDGLVPTDSFAIPRTGDRVRVDARMGSSTGRVVGVLATAGGALAIAAGGLALVATPVLESEDVGSKGFRTAVLAGGVGAVSVGVVAAAAGLYLWLSNGSHARTEQVASK